VLIGRAGQIHGTSPFQLYTGFPQDVDRHLSRVARHQGKTVEWSSALVSILLFPSSTPSPISYLYPDPAKHLFPPTLLSSKHRLPHFPPTISYYLQTRKISYRDVRQAGKGRTGVCLHIPETYIRRRVLPDNKRHKGHKSARRNRTVLGPASGIRINWLPSSHCPSC